MFRVCMCIAWVRLCPPRMTRHLALCRHQPCVARVGCSGQVVLYFNDVKEGGETVFTKAPGIDHHELPADSRVPVREVSQSNVILHNYKSVCLRGSVVAEGHTVAKVQR